MKVVCKINNLNKIPDPYVVDRLRKYISKPDGDVDLDVGREYKVYGVVFWDNFPWYYLCVEEYDEYPKPYSSDFFDVVDDRLSPLWKLSSFYKGENEAATSLVFDKWANDPDFYEKLVDGDAEAARLFKRYKIILDQE